jgi:hypothetical protein
VTLEMIKQELAVMPEEQQDALAAYLAHLRHLRNPNARKELARNIDDRDPANWISLEQLKEHWKE